MNQDGSEKEVYSIGHRNPVGMDFNPTTGELWSNDNQVDGLGDDIPPVAPVFFAFRIMVGLGFAMLSPAWLGAWMTRPARAAR